jgi:hypothetical protein
MPLPAGELYTTYSCLKAFLMSEIERMVPGRIAFHGKHELLVWSSPGTFVELQGL